MAVELVFESHSTIVDNERGLATGWLPGTLSDRGRIQARDLGNRRRDDGFAAVFSSDLRRARSNGMPAAQLHRGRAEHLDQPYPEGESWVQAVTCVGRFLGDLPLRWDGRRAGGKDGCTGSASFCRDTC